MNIQMSSGIDDEICHPDVQVSSARARRHRSGREGRGGILTERRRDAEKMIQYEEPHGAC
jgi:hypothetical protein